MPAEENWCLCGPRTFQSRKTRDRPCTNAAGWTRSLTACGCVYARPSSHNTDGFIIYRQKMCLLECGHQIEKRCVLCCPSLSTHLIIYRLSNMYQNFNNSIQPMAYWIGGGGVFYTPCSPSSLLPHCLFLVDFQLTDNCYSFRVLYPILSFSTRFHLL